MNKLRIQKGEFEGELLYKGHVYPFAAIRSHLGLSVSFDTSENPSGDLPTDYELFKALEGMIYGQSSD